MCSRFADAETSAQLRERFAVADDETGEWEPRYSIAPTDRAPVVRVRKTEQQASVRVLELAAFDFRPAWRTDRAPRINATIEEVAKNGLWREGFKAHRCLVPMTGYFEWTGAAGKKQPHFLHVADEVLTAAGIMTARRVETPQGGNGWSVSMAVVTTEGRDASGEIHDRMPVFLPPTHHALWLDPNPINLQDERRVHEFLDEIDAASTEVAAKIVDRLVDPKVNNAQKLDPHDPTLIEPTA